MKNTIKILYAIINTHKERLFTFLLIAILISGAMYGFLLKNTIDNVVEREKLSKEINSIFLNDGSKDSRLKGFFVCFLFEFKISDI
jgi:Tfp pilus assembly protein PilO